MKFLKALTLAVFISFLLTYVFGVSLMQWFDISIYMDQQPLEPFHAISYSALLVVTIVMAVMIILLSVFGTIIFIGLLAIGGILMLLSGFIWPVFFIAFVIWVFLKDSDNDISEA